MISKGFVKSSLIYTVVGSLPLIAGVILLPFYANLLSITDFGILALYISFTFLVQTLVNWGLDTFIGIHYFDYKDNPAQLKAYLGTVAVALLVFGAVAVLVMAILGKLLFENLFSDGSMVFYPFGFMSVLTAVFNSFFKTYSNLLITRQKPEEFFWIHILNFILTLAISIIGLYMFPNSLIGPMYGRLLSALLMFFVTFLLYYREFGLAYHSEHFREMIRFSSPLMIYYTVLWVASYIDRYIINFYLDPKDVGVFDLAIKCTLVLDFLQTGLASAINPKIFTIWKDNKLTESTPEVNRYYSGFTAVFLFCIPAFTVIIPLIVPLVVKNHDFFACFVFIALLGAGYATRGLYNMFFAPLLFQKKTTVLPRVFFFATVIQVVITILLVRNIGMVGAVWAAFLAKPIQLFFIWLESRKIFDFRFNVMKMVVLPLIYIALVLFAQIVLTDLNYQWVNVAEMIVIYILLYFTYRKELRFMYEKLMVKK